MAGGNLRPETLHGWEQEQKDPLGTVLLGIQSWASSGGSLAPPWQILGTLSHPNIPGQAEGRWHSCSPLHLCQGGGFGRPFLILPRSQRDERSPCSLNIACSRPDLGVPAGAVGTPWMSLEPHSRLFPRLCWALVPAKPGLWDRAAQGRPTGAQIYQHGLIRSFWVGSQPPLAWVLCQLVGTHG